MAAASYTLFKGGLFSYIGELRIPVNRVPVIDYTGWQITGRLEDYTGLVIDILTVEWVDITLGLFRFAISAADQSVLKEGRDYKLYIVLRTPANEPLAPIIVIVSVKET